MTQLAPFLVVLGRLNVRDGRVKPKPPIRQAHLRTGPAATVVVLPGRTTPEVVLTGVHLGAEERAALERIALLAAVAVDQARDLTGMNHHSDLADKIGELIAAAGQAERRATW